MARNISLIGFRGTGKTTVGKLLAQRIGFLCVDTDEVIEQRSGRSITELFEQRGEAEFRDIESEVIAELTAKTGRVLSLGGGAILREANRERIRACGPVVWLRANVVTIAQRMDLDPTTAARRPNLTSAGGTAEIEDLLRERLPLYEACASLAIDTDHRSPEELVDSIVNDCGLHAG